MEALIPVILVIVLAWVYDFWNGANDCANSIAVSVSTKALSFKKAIFLAGIFNLLGAFITTEVAKTIGKGIVPLEEISQILLIFALFGAITWTAFSTKFGIPISVTHSLVGGLVGAGIVGVGFRALEIKGLFKVALGIIGAPLISFAVSAIFFILVAWIIKFIFSKIPVDRLNRNLRKGQIFASLSVALAHGMNDTQNAMGVITASLFVGGFLSEFKVPFWVILGSGIFMALGTIYGGHKVIKTVGRRIYKLKPVHGFPTEMSSAVLIFLHSLGGIPLSTTQVVTAGVMGVGGIERKARVNWRKIAEIFFTWIFTIPGAALISGFGFFIFELITGV